MVHDAHDQDEIALHAVEYAMPAVNEAAYALAEFGSRHACQRIFTEQVERFIEAKEIGVGRVGVELVYAVFTDGDKIDPGCGAQVNLSHAAPDARP